MYTDADLLPLSGLQHMIYCPRQCGLIHVDREWEENRFTAEGRVLHERIDAGGDQVKSGVHLRYSLALKSLKLGVFGVSDCVEFHTGPAGSLRPLPVETKRGKPKSLDADRVQVCAQAICLEEMFGVEIPEAVLFYATPRRREVVALEAPLREQTADAARNFHAMMETGELPRPCYRKKRCDRCSLFGVCQPRQKSVSGWLAQQLSGKTP